MTKDCIFCKISKGELPCKKVWEDGNFLAFYDLRPQVEKHCLVISKKHFDTIVDFDSILAPGLFDAINKTFKTLNDSDEFSGFNLIQNNFKSAGQVVDHIHFHILPRKDDDCYSISIGKK